MNDVAHGVIKALSEIDGDVQLRVWSDMNDKELLPYRVEIVDGCVRIDVSENDELDLI